MYATGILAPISPHQVALMICWDSAAQNFVRVLWGRICVVFGRHVCIYQGECTPEFLITVTHSLLTVQHEIGERAHPTGTVDLAVVVTTNTIYNLPYVIFANAVVDVCPHGTTLTMWSLSSCSYLSNRCQTSAFKSSPPARYFQTPRGERKKTFCLLDKAVTGINKRHAPN
jgi:hypothetical protein